MLNLMENTHSHNAVALAKRVGKAAHAQGLPKDPREIPGLAKVIDSDPVLAPRIKAAFLAGYTIAERMPV